MLNWLGGVGLRDGAGEGLVVHVDDQLPALDEVLKLLDGRSHGEEHGIKSRIPNSGSVSQRLKKKSG